MKLSPRYGTFVFQKLNLKLLEDEQDFYRKPIILSSKQDDDASLHDTNGTIRKYLYQTNKLSFTSALSTGKSLKTPYHFFII